MRRQTVLITAINAAILAFSLQTAMAAQVDSSNIINVTNGSNIINYSDENMVIIENEVIGVFKPKGNTKTENRKLASFKCIEIELPVQATFQITDNPFIALVAESDLLPRITSTISGDCLVLAIKGSAVMSTPVKAMIGGQTLNDISIIGSGSLQANNLETSSLNVKIQGSGDFTAHDVHTSAIKIQIHGSGSLTISGEASKADVVVNGSGSVDLTQAQTRLLSSALMGSGSIAANASEQATASLTGSGSILIYGNPAAVSSKKIGSGEINVKQHP